MRALSQQISALIVIGLCVAALIGAGAEVSGMASRLQRGLDARQATAPLTVAADLAARLSALLPEPADTRTS